MTLLDKQFVVYFDEETHKRIKNFAKKKDISMNQLMREGVEHYIDNVTPFAKGFNTGIKKAMIVVKKNKSAQMRFPSGESIAELINQDLEGLIRNENIKRK